MKKSIKIKPVSVDENVDIEAQEANGAVQDDVTTVKDDVTPLHALSFAQFMQGTSFHGVNYIFKPGASIFRRIAWTLAVLACMGLFTYQVVTRVQDYYDYPSSVNVEVIYETEVEFPAVTFCNQNSFRAYRTTELDMQNVVMERYSPGGTNELQAEVPDNLNLTYREFVLTASHQIEDMLESCTWAKKPCQPSHFTQIITDFGVCYTFNGGNTSLTLEDYGSVNGLILILNIEKYEDLAGPHKDIGLKVLLHDPIEYPLLKSQGITVGTGQHALMSVQMTKTESLPAPYGNCIEDALPRSHCIIHCEADTMMQECGCHDAYIPDAFNASYCNFDVAFECDLNGDLGKKCVCDVPCSRTKFSADLSYADIEQDLVTQIWSGQQTRLQETLQNYITATEYIHRNNPVVFNKTSKQYVIYANYFADLIDIAGDLDQYLSGVVTSGQTVTIDTIISEDLDTLQDVYESKRDLLTARRHGYIESDLQMLNTHLERLLEVNGVGDTNDLTSQLVTSLENCTNNNASLQGNDSVPSLPDDVTRDILTQSRDGFLAWKEIYLNQTLDVYKTAYGDVFDFDYVITEQQTCVDAIAKIQGDTVNATGTILELMEAYENTSTCVEALDIARKMFDTYLDLRNLTSHNFTDVIPSVCYPPDNNIDLSSVGKTIANKPLSRLAEQIIDPMVTDLQRWNYTLMSPLLQYLSTPGDRKYDLIRVLRGESYVYTLHVFYNSLTGSVSGLDGSVNSIKYYFEDVVRSYETMYGSLPFPVVSDASWEDDLKLLKFVERNFQNDTAILSLAQEVRNNGPDAVTFLGHLLQNISSQYQNYLQQETDTIAQTFVTMEEHYNKILNELDKFVDMEADLLDTSNFIQLDIFYEELSYSRIKQQESFPFISLLSEIGGFLGLLLGASVLTVCEILDFITVTCLRKCQGSS